MQGSLGEGVAYLSPTENARLNVRDKEDAMLTEC